MAAFRAVMGGRWLWGSIGCKIHIADLVILDFRDTANVYSNGVSEEIIGKAIKKYNLPREKLVILSKCYGYVGEEPGVR